MRGPGSLTSLTQSYSLPATHDSRVTTTFRVFRRKGPVQQLSPRDTGANRRAALAMNTRIRRRAVKGKWVRWPEPSSLPRTVGKTGEAGFSSFFAASGFRTDRPPWLLPDAGVNCFVAVCFHRMGYGFVTLRNELAEAWGRKDASLEPCGGWSSALPLGRQWLLRAGASTGSRRFSARSGLY